MATAAVFSLGAAPRVNLMPRAETERRATASLLRRWLLGIVLALALVVLLAGAAFWLQVSAAARLIAENARTTTLLGQVAELAPVSEKLGLESDLATFRAEAMGTQVSWAPLVRMVEGVTPEGAEVTGFVLAPQGLPVGDDPALEAGVNGAMTITSDTVIDIVPIIRELRAVEGVLAVDGREAVAETDGYRYQVLVTFDQSAYTGAYAPEAAE